jgi:hypothetical protein
VGLGHGANDRETQTEGATAVAGAADKTLEQGLAQVLGHAGAIVLDDQQSLAVIAEAGGNADLGASGGVAQRVLEQVDREAVELVACAEDGDWPCLPDVE